MVGTAVGLHWFWRAVLFSASQNFKHRWEPAIVRWYEQRVRWALDHRALTLGGSLAALVLTVVAFSFLHSGIEYFPENVPPKQVFVDVELPVGSRVDATDAVARRMEEELKIVPGREDWKSEVSTIGSGGSGGASAMMGQGGPGGPASGRVGISFVEFQQRDHDPFETLSWMQEHLGRDVAGAVITTQGSQEGPATGAPVTIEIVGSDPARLKQLSDRVLDVLQAAPVYAKLVALESDMDEAQAELSVTVDREKAALYDLSTAEVGRAIRGAIQGVEAAKYRTGDDEYDVVVRLAAQYRNELENLRDLTVMSEGRQVPLSSVASWDVKDGYGSIHRKDQTRMATITSDVNEGLNDFAVLVEVQQTLAPFVVAEMPPGYTINYTGQNQDQQEAQEFLLGAFMTAVMVIALILVSQFNSVIKPFIIMTSVLLSTMGVLLGLMIFRMPFVVIMTGIGIISLAGIVVNNSIVMIDYIDTLRERDAMNRSDALVRAGMTRFRPVILTALTTALGLVPLAIGLNLDFFGFYRSLRPELFWGGDQAAWWGSMCVSVIAGILFATFLTLILVPVMYSILDDVSDWFRSTYIGDGPSGGLQA
jgi:multidrug efflux pump subunit AcrB